MKNQNEVHLKTRQCRVCASLMLTAYAIDTMTIARERTLLRKLGLSFFIFGLINNGEYANLFLL